MNSISFMHHPASLPMSPSKRTLPLTPFLLLLATLGAGAEAVPTVGADPTPTPTPAPGPAPAPAPAPAQEPAAEATPVDSTVRNERFALEFRAARLGQVLDYLAKEAGFILTNPAQVLAAPITLVAKQPVTPTEAVEALNGVLVEQGFAAIVRGRTLRIVPLPTAKQQNLPVMVGADPELIPESDRMITQIIPIQFATAKDLAESLQPLLNPATATLSTVESSNLLMLTDTQSNIKRIVGIIHAIDSSVSGELEIKVYHLAHAAADKVATMITTLYGKGNTAGNSGRGGNGSDPLSRMFGNGGGGGGGGGDKGGGKSTGGASHSADVSAAADTGTNTLVVRASPIALKSLSQVISQLDTDTNATDGILVYKVRNAKAKDLATAMSSLFSSNSTGGGANNRNNTQNRGVTGRNANGAAAGGNGGGAPAGGGSDTLDLTGQVVVVAEATSNSVLILSPERNFDRIRKILVELDQPMRQVLVRMLVAEVTLEDGLDAGVELTGNNTTDSTTTTGSSVFNLSDNKVGMNGFLMNSSYFTATVHALASTTRFDVMSRPYILTTDNQVATVKVIQEVPIVTGSRTDANNNVSTTFQRQDVGIILSVTPQINSDGRVVLQVSQELSALTDQTQQVAPDVTSPIIRNRSMTTKVTMDKGQTVVVGGLVSDTFTEKVRQVPWLGDIPYLGALFRRTERTKAKTELLVFLTPTVVQTAEDLNQMSSDVRSDMRNLHAAVENEALQGHIDELMALPVGEPLPVKPVRTIPVKSAVAPAVATPAVAGEKP